MELNQMGPDAAIIASMSNAIHTSAAMQPFSAELILTKLANNDEIIRMYHDKSAECQQIQQNLESLSGTAAQIRQLYENEKDRADGCTIEVEMLQEQLTNNHKQLAEVQHDLINSSTLSEQTIADLEDRLKKKEDEYLTLCRDFMEQANVLHENNLLVPQMMRRCNVVKQILQRNGIQCELRSIERKNKRKSAMEDRQKAKIAEEKRVKTIDGQSVDATARTFEKGTPCQQSQTSTATCEMGTQYEQSQAQSTTCEKGTQYQQSKATRSTCTSAFITFADMATNTDPEHPPINSDRVDAILHEMITRQTPHLSPLHDIEESTNSSKTISTQTLTQTQTKTYSTQGTITAIYNVRNRLSCVKQCEDDAPEVKSEDVRMPLRSMLSSFAMPYQNNASAAYSDPLLLQVWSMLGELLFSVLDRASVIDEKRTNGVQLMQKIHEIRSMITDNCAKGPVNEFVDMTGPVNMETNACADEHSRDSVESYNSAKVIISTIRNLNSSSPVLDDKRCSPERRHFTPIKLRDENRSPNSGNLADAGAPTVTKQRTRMTPPLLGSPASSSTSRLATPSPSTSPSTSPQSSSPQHSSPELPSLQPAVVQTKRNKKARVNRATAKQKQSQTQSIQSVQSKVSDAMGDRAMGDSIGSHHNSATRKRKSLTSIPYSQTKSRKMSKTITDLFGTFTNGKGDDDDDVYNVEKNVSDANNAREECGEKECEKEQENEEDNEECNKKITEICQYFNKYDYELITPIPEIIVSDEDSPQVPAVPQNAQVAEVSNVNELPLKEVEQTQESAVCSDEPLTDFKIDDAATEKEAFQNINEETEIQRSPVSEPMAEDKATTIAEDMEQSMEAAEHTETNFDSKEDSTDILNSISETQNLPKITDGTDTTNEHEEEAFEKCMKLACLPDLMDDQCIDDAANHEQMETQSTDDDVSDLARELIDNLSDDSDTEPIDENVAAETLHVSNTIADTIEHESLEEATFQSSRNESAVSQERVSSSEECFNVLHNKSYDDYSPASPKPEAIQCTKSPLEIPLNIRRHCEEIDAVALPGDTSVIDHLIYNYSVKVFNERMSRYNRVGGMESYLVACIRSAIGAYCAKSTPVGECVDRILSLTRRPIWMTQAILEAVEDTREPLSEEFTPPAPAMPSSIQKILVLTTHLDRCVSGLAALVQFELDRRLFQVNTDIPVACMVNLAQFFTGLIDIERPQNKAKVRLFIYKSLYYSTFKAIPLVLTVIMAHPNALPHASNVELSCDPLVRMFAAILSNIVYTNKSDSAYRKIEMFTTLKRRFGFFAGHNFPLSCAMDFCINQLKANRLKNVSYALILLSKRKGAEWGMKEIVEKQLVPLLHQYFTHNLSAINEYDQQIVVIITTISLIVKTLPVNENVDGFLDMFSRCLQVTERQIIQEAAVSALCQMNRFGCAKIDIDEELLKRRAFIARPLSWDLLNIRAKKLQVDVYAGSIDSPHDCLKSTDVVVCIEIIEHLYPETEQNLVHNIFGSMKPKIAIFTTPNGEYNVVFPTPRQENGFRHYDHKFEWTQEQFVDWALNICERYPMYRVHFGGIGSAPSTFSSTIGKCTQYVCFVQKFMVNLLSINHLETMDQCVERCYETDKADVYYPIEKHPYKLICSHEYPWERRDRLTIIRDQVHRALDSLFFVARSPYKNKQKQLIIISIADLLTHIRPIHNAPDVSEHELRDIVKSEFALDDKDTIVYPYYNFDSDSEDDEYYGDYDLDRNDENYLEKARALKEKELNERWQRYSHQTKDEAIRDEIKTFIRHNTEVFDFEDTDKDAFVIPISSLLVYTPSATDEAELRDSIQSEYVIDDSDCIIFPLYKKRRTNYI